MEYTGEYDQVMRYLAHKEMEAQKNEAVDFAEWLITNTYEQRWKDFNRRFLNKDAKPYTSEQLYDKYKNQ